MTIGDGDSSPDIGFECVPQDVEGAVTFGEDFERSYMSQIFELQKGMIQAIFHFSRYEDAAVELKDEKYQYKGEDKKIASAVVMFVFTANFGHPSHPATPSTPASQNAPVK